MFTCFIGDQWKHQRNWIHYVNHNTIIDLGICVYCSSKKISVRTQKLRLGVWVEVTEVFSNFLFLLLHQVQNRFSGVGSAGCCKASNDIRARKQLLWNHTIKSKNNNRIYECSITWQFSLFSLSNHSCTPLTVFLCLLYYWRWSWVCSHLGTLKDCSLLKSVAMLSPWLKLCGRLALPPYCSVLSHIATS